LLGTVSSAAHHGVELAVLVSASLLATALRFTLLRTWVFGTSSTNPTANLR
jgi:hypothetical protein